MRRYRYCEQMEAVNSRKIIAGRDQEQGIEMRERLEKGKRIKRKYFIAFLVIWAVQMAAAFYFCVQKQGFHEDEYYTYYSTARTNGFYVEDGQWMDRETYRNEFVVLPEQRFQYGLIKQVQSWDVHPPMYYWVFHTAASLVPGVFSKWIGLTVNLVLWGINIVLLAYLAYVAGGRSGKMAFLVTLFYGLSPAALSGVVFIRMYEMLTMFVLLCAILHVQAVRYILEARWDKLPVIRCLIPMAVVTYLGFLTQYYYFIFLFYLAAAFCVWLLWRERKIWNCMRYGVSQGIAFALAYLTYPSCLGQMFRGQRGAQATENFFDLSNTVQRFRFFYELLDEYVFGKMLPVLLLQLLVLAVTAYRQRSMWKIQYESEKKRGKEPFEQKRAAEEKGAVSAILVFTVLGYFLTVSKTALLLGDTSNRYQLPVYGIIVLLFFHAVRVLWKRLAAGNGIGKRIYAVYTAGRGYVWAVTIIICLLIDVSGLMDGRVVFLYPEDREQVDFARFREQENTPVIYLYEPGAEWCIWDVADELFMYSEVYFAAMDSTDVIRDDRIENADALVVYIANGADEEAQISRIAESSRKLSGRSEDRQPVFEEKYCRVYYFQ